MKGVRICPKHMDGKLSSEDPKRCKAPHSKVHLRRDFGGWMPPKLADKMSALQNSVIFDEV